jgi:putative SOS response-associated peptidase YedK
VLHLIGAQPVRAVSFHREDKWIQANSADTLANPIAVPGSDHWRISLPPTQNVLAIRRNPETGERTLDALRWGLIPNWAKDEKIAYKTINARVETVDTAPSYRQAFKKRRCLIPVDGFY